MHRRIWLLPLHKPFLMPDRIHIEALQPEHLAELATVLRHPAVYEHIEHPLPSLDDFMLDLQRGLAGPPPQAHTERWLHFLVRDESGQMIGRLEATLHHGIAELALLFGPSSWGRGLASEALRWLHGHVQAQPGIRACWATTTPANLRCQRLLHAHGYHSAALPDVPLYSHEDGDLALCRLSER